MKIAITSQGKNLNAEIDPRFGRCHYFIILDTENDEFEVIENPNVSSGGGAGIQTAQTIAEKGVQAILTGNVGPNAFQTLSAADIEIYTGISGSVSTAVEQFKKGILKSCSSPSVESHSGLHSTSEKTRPSPEKKRIAVAAEDDQGLKAAVSAHFGRCPYYTMVEVENKTVTLSYMIENPFYGAHGQPGQVPGFIRDQGAHVIIAGGMGQRAVGFFSEFGIEVITGAQGQVKNAVEAYLKGTLKGAAGCANDSCHGHIEEAST